MRLAACLALGASAVALEACGGGGGGGGGGTCTPSQSASMTLSASGVSPKAVCVLPTNGTVAFTNNDTVQHSIEFETSCSGVTGVSVDPSGGTKSVAFTIVQTCTFHDKDSSSNAAFQGTIAVAAAMVTGAGY